MRRTEVFSSSNEQHAGFQVSTTTQGIGYIDDKLRLSKLRQICEERGNDMNDVE